MSASEELESGRLAKGVLENPAFQAAMSQIQTEIVTKWQAEKDGEQREWLWALMQASKRLESVLKSTMETGQFRAQQIELQRSRLEKAGSAFKRAFGS